MKRIGTKLIVGLFSVVAVFFYCRNDEPIQPPHQSSNQLSIEQVRFSRALHDWHDAPEAHTAARVIPARA